ncbi:imidazole glycerol phosphate synthase subunit HisH [Candidatus Poriferisocius sp.]|uniref:imidazole glycerol phosphate synthase subunit HisH n=1 Tax=Candidatus Poriferisocius sp. TaxID=3101276 RepID=UPI003B01392D
MSRPLIAVLDYGIGNLRSAQKGLERMGADARLTSDPGLIAEASAVVLPGVGAFGPCMTALQNTGLDLLARSAATDGRPFLGICIGLQLLYEGSEEAPGITGLGVLPGTVRKLPDGVKHPQMQWNRLEVKTPGPMLAGLEEAWVYFVHSYAAPLAGNVAATCEYGGPVVAAVADKNVWATQFHPEKSARPGLQLLENFVNQARHR